MNQSNNMNPEDYDSVLDEPDPLPGILQLLNPVYVLQWTIGFLEGWLFSREYSRLWTTMPVLVVVVAGLTYWTFSSTSAADNMVADLEEKIQQAVAAGDKQREVLYSKALVGLRPEDPALRYRAALLLVDDNPSEAISRMAALAPEGSGGYAPARLWLVRQAQEEQPLFAMTSTQMKFQLQQVLRTQPDNQEAHFLLAQLYLRNSEWQLAEQELGALMFDFPHLALEMARVKLRLNRDRLDIEKYLSDAETYFNDVLSQSPEDSLARLALADTLTLRGRYSKARELLLLELRRNDQQSLRRRISMIDLAESEHLTRESRLNLDHSLLACWRAIEVDPGNPAILNRLLQLNAQGLRIPADRITAALDWWRYELNRTPEDADARTILGQYLVLSAEFAAAVEVLQPLLDQKPELRLPMVKLLNSAGSRDKAVTLQAEIEQSSRERYLQNKADLPNLITLASVLLSSKRSDEVRDLLAEFRDLPANASQNELSLQALYGKASLESYDQQVPKLLKKDKQAVTGEEIQQVLLPLMEASRIPPTLMAALQRVARLAFSENVATRSAREMLQNIRLAGAANSKVLSLIGSVALMENQKNEAVSYLELANAVSKGNDLAITNNLVLARLRSGQQDFEALLELVNSALTAFPDHPDFLSTRAEIYVAMQRWEDALADLNDSLPHRPNSANVHKLLGEVLAQLGDESMAKLHRERSEELNNSKDAN